MFQRLIPLSYNQLELFKTDRKFHYNKNKVDENGNIMILFKKNLENKKCCICHDEYQFAGSNYIEGSLIYEDKTKFMCYYCYICGYKYQENEDCDKFQFQNIKLNDNEFNELINHTKYYEPIELIAPRIIDYMSLINHFHNPLFVKILNYEDSKKNTWFFKITEDSPVFILSCYRKKEHLFFPRYDKLSNKYLVDSDDTFTNKIKNYVGPKWTSHSIDKLYLYIPQPFNGHKLLINFIIKKLQDIDIYEKNNTFPIFRKLLMEPDFYKYKDQCFKFGLGELNHVEKDLREKFLPVADYVNNIIYEYKNKVTRCDCCLAEKPRVNHVSSGKNKFKRSAAENIATELDAYGLCSGYESGYDNEYEGGLWYSSEVLHNLWKDGMSVVCDNCLEKFISQGLLEVTNISSLDYEFNSLDKI